MATTMSNFPFNININDYNLKKFTNANKKDIIPLIAHNTYVPYLY